VQTCKGCKQDGEGDELLVVIFINVSNRRIRNPVQEFIPKCSVLCREVKMLLCVPKTKTKIKIIYIFQNGAFFYFSSLEHMEEMGLEPNTP
jgi:hypothetical protein